MPIELHWPEITLRLLCVLVAGVTTAATLWLLTVLGLCFGGGQVTLGLVGAALGVLVLTGLKLLEDRMAQGHQGTLFIGVRTKLIFARFFRMTVFGLKPALSRQRGHLQITN